MNRPTFSHLVWNPSGVAANPTIKFYQDILAFLQSRGLATGQFQRDGKLGSNTTAAVRAFQTSAVQRGSTLAVDGVLGNATKEALLIVAPQALAAGFIRSVTPPGGTRVGASSNDGQSQGGKGGSGGEDGQSQGGKGGSDDDDDDDDDDDKDGQSQGGNASTGSKVVGTQPKVSSIVTKGNAAGPGQTVAVPESVSKMISPETAQQLSNMPPDQVRSFVGQLEQRATTEASTATEDVALNAVPVVDSAGRVSLGVTRTPAGIWDTLSGGEKAAVIGGSVVVGLGLIAVVIMVASGPRSNPPKRRRRRR